MSIRSYAQVVTVLVAATTLRVPLSAQAMPVEPEPVFQFDASLGAAIALNGDTGKTVSELAGVTGEVKLFAIDWLPVTEGFALLSGPGTINGSLFLALAPAAVPDSVLASDSTLTFDNASWGWLRLELPLMAFRERIWLQGVLEDGFAAFRSLPNLWHQYFYGLQLQMGSPDSYVEWLWGKSENLRPVDDTRVRITVQLQIPETPITFRLVSSRAPEEFRRDPSISDNPIGLAVFTKIDVVDFFRTVVGVIP